MSNRTETIERIMQVVNGRQDVVAILVPRCLALRLVDELYPEESFKEDTGVVGIDIAHRVRYDSREKERSRYKSLVADGGYVGKIFNYPMVVAEDVVVCSLSREELLESADRFGVNATEILGG